MTSQSGLIPLAQDYARVSRDTNYQPIIIKRAKQDRTKQAASAQIVINIYLNIHLFYENNILDLSNTSTMMRIWPMGRSLPYNILSIGGTTKV